MYKGKLCAYLTVYVCEKNDFVAYLESNQVDVRFSLQIFFSVDDYCTVFPFFFLSLSHILHALRPFQEHFIFEHIHVFAFENALACFT